MSTSGGTRLRRLPNSAHRPATVRTNNVHFEMKGTTCREVLDDVAVGIRQLAGGDDPIHLDDRSALLDGRRRHLDLGEGVPDDVSTICPHRICVVGTGPA